MPLSQESVAAILAYLDPYLDTLETGFPTSTRPNEPLLTKDLKRAKIEATLQKDPAIFLTKWGSVILYPRPQAKPATGEEINDVNGGASHKVESLTPAKNILDLFNPLAVDYEVRYHLTRLYQQLQQLMEHANFEALRQQRQDQRQPSGLNSADNITIANNSIHNRSHGYNPTSTTNYMDTDPNLSAQQTNSDNKDIPEEDRKPNPGQNDLFTRSTLSQNTRRNRRLNYLLRHLAPPDGSESSGVAGVASSMNSASSAPGVKNPSAGASSLLSSSAGASQSKASRDLRNPALASILSISGSMSNLSFSESTYFSDAEMEARAPDLYRQYIGRFMDQDDDRDSQGEEEEEEDDQGGVTGAEDADDEREDADTRQSSASPEPFGKDVGLVDRILWNIDHPTRKQQKKQLQEGLESRRAAQGRNAGEGSSSSHALAGSLHQQSIGLHDRTASAVAPPASESDFEEEFDTESDVDDADMADSAQNQEKADEQDMEVEKDERKGPLKNIADDQLLATTSVTPPLPPTPVPGVVSSTFASAAMTLEQPESRAWFAALESGNGLGSSEDEAPELDQATKERKGDQEALRQEFVLLMKQRFLDGLDSQFDYSLVDFDEDLDDLEQEDHDVEDRYFDAEDEGEDDEDDEDDDGEILDGQLSSRRQVGRAPGSGHPRRMNYDERVQAWENSAQNGAGDYDY
ncbi:hypothetical protein BGZ47_000973 [Haplosporangium gracile]|nr:hypothetical protein BGZ47_000973 [Haplosporangium gracile]